MFQRLKRLYEDGRLTVDGLKAAIERGWINEEEYSQIVGE